MTATSTQAFICDLYPATRRSTSTTDESRYLMFCQQKTSNENAAINVRLLKAATESIMARGILMEKLAHWNARFGESQREWVVTRRRMLETYVHDEEPVSRSLVELPTCKCEKSYCRGNCSCSSTSLSCTEAFSYITDESCANPHTAAVQLLRDSENDSEDDLTDSDVD